MVSLLLSLAVATPAPDLAFVARFYLPGKAKSSYQLYVSDWNLTKRKSYPVPSSPNAVRWLGSDALAVSTDEGIYVSTLINWRPKLVKGTKNLRFQDSRWTNTPRGVPYIESEVSQTIDLKTHKLIALEPAVQTRDIAVDEDKAIEVRDPDGNWLLLRTFEMVTYKDGGRNFVSDLNFIRAWKSVDKMFLILGDHSSTSGDENCLVRLEKGEKSTVVFEGANAFDFQPESPFAAYCTIRTTSPLGKIQVWSSELHTLNHQTGEKSTLLKGAVHVPSVSVRPI